MKYNILIGGQAGQGVDTLSTILEKFLKRKGYFVFSNKDYMSRIRGGHNFIQIRFGNEPIYSHHQELDIILSLDEQTVNNHMNRLNEEGTVICDESININNKKIIKLPMIKTAKEIGAPKTFGSVALGALLKLFSFNFNDIDAILKEKFDEKTSKVNFEAIKKGYDLLNSHYEINDSIKDSHILINGNQAIALGALAAGVSFYSGYPMTPSTSIMTYLSSKQKDAKIVVEQAEDEIAAINMALGASFAGARAMTATSGGGLSLMTEALGLAGITETPLVVTNVQRPGPATGFPTRTEQGDLSFILTASHGEIPRMVIAVKNPTDAFYQTARAFNIADKYQILVIIISDQYLADYNQTIEPFDFNKITIERNIKKTLPKEYEYKRYEYTENGISPRIIPGKFENQIVLADSDEHNEWGHITESAQVRVEMVNKRMGKLDLLKDELIEPEYFGPDNPETLLIGWGSMYGPLREAIEMLNIDGISVGTLIFGDIFPLPTKLLEKYSKVAKKIVNVEQNYTGQLAKLIRQETGVKCNHSILKYDGRQMDPSEIYIRIRNEVL